MPDFQTGPVAPSALHRPPSALRRIRERVLEPLALPAFDRYLYSPHRRTRETAARLELPGVQWRLDRLLRERERGELASLMSPDHERLHPANHAWTNTDGLKWVPTGGESIVQVADNRVGALLDSLHRAHDEKRVDSVIAVTHGDFIWATELVLDHMSDEAYAAAELDWTPPPVFGLPV